MSLLIFRGKGYLVILSALAGWGIAAFLNRFVLGRFWMMIPGGFFLRYMITVLAIAVVNYEATKHFCKPRECKEVGLTGSEHITVVKDPSHLFYTVCFWRLFQRDNFCMLHLPEVSSKRMCASLREF